MAAPGDVPPAFRNEAGLTRLRAGAVRAAWRERHLTIPLAMPPLMLAAGELAHVWHHDGYVLVIAAATAVITWVGAPRKWSAAPRRNGWAWTSEVAYARATAAGGAIWVTIAAYSGLSGPLDVAMLTGCVAWGIPFWAHKRPRDRKARKRHALRVAKWDAWWHSHSPGWGLAGSGVVDVKDHGAMESLLVQLWGGKQSFATIRNVVPLLESALGGYVHHAMTRIEVNKKNPSQVWVHLKKDDPLRSEVKWDYQALSTDICDPVGLGVRETGTWLEAHLRRSWFVVGRSRSGKSNELSVMLAKITKCRNSRAFLIDMKGGRATRPWLKTLEWVATTTDEADIMLMFFLAEIKARAQYADTGEEQLTPTAEVPTLFLVIDETYEVTSAMSGAPGATRRAGWLATIASQGQGVEIYIIDATQYGALAESLQTEQTRSNLNGRLCFQTESPEHGIFALGDDLGRQGIDTTRLEQKGTFYYRADAKTHPEQVRGPHIPHRQVREIAARNAELTGLHDRPLLPYCGNFRVSDESSPTWNQVYADRWLRLPESFRKDVADQVADLLQGVTSSPAPPRESGEGANKINMSRPEHETAARINAELDEDPNITDEDIRRARDLRAARGEGPVDLAAEGDQRRRRFATLLQAATAAQPISPAQLKRGSGLANTTVHQHLRRLEAAGAVTKIGDARYAATDIDIWAVMESIRAEAARLGSTAREMAETAS